MEFLTNSIPAVYREEDGFSLLRDSGIIQVSMLPGDGDENEEENFLNTQVIIDDIPAAFHSRRKMSFTSVRMVHSFLK